MPHIFPNAREGSDEGLLAYGGDLNPNRLLTAYRKGIFPWFNPEDPILWWSPNPRLILYPNEFKRSKSLKRVIKNKGFEVRFDTNFEAVIDYCSTVPREGQVGTWLTEEMKESYIELHKMGFAHSIETYLEDKLVGGFYGVSMGKAFFGESMFALVPNASKVALSYLSNIFVQKCYDFIDCQVETPHLVSLGARLISRDDFLDQLEDALEKPSDIGSWSEWSNNVGLPTHDK
ncbi:MAG TPA: leucyl/phenylalanyl-tRNA--protein transferase [Campylobacterales bacterium]|nr:leucyl/phenylalanyl-tRNA--protein transferase [Campylobacterales bacterium]HHH51075.1 leucyl/phenylalanyl-tRNA--protein transferase [Campylobacterales bacterium]